MIHSFNSLPNLANQFFHQITRPTKIILVGTALTVFLAKMSEITNAIDSSLNQLGKRLNTFDYRPHIQAKIVPIDQASTLEVKSHVELLNGLDLFSKFEMERCLSDNSYHLRKFINKIDIFDYFYKQGDVKDACNIATVNGCRTTLNGRCALASDKSPLVLSVLSNREVSQSAHEERMLTIPIKVKDLGCDISMKYAKNPFEICRFLDEAKAQYGKPVDHLLISAHGRPDEIAWEEGELSTNTHFPADCFKSLASDATISLVSCDTGNNAVESYQEFLVKSASDNSWIHRQSIVVKNSIAQHFANEAQKTVFAPTGHIGMHEFDLIKNSNSSLSANFFPKLVNFNRSNIRNIGAKWNSLEAKDATGIFFPQKHPVERTSIILENGKKVFEKVILKEKNDKALA